MQAAKAPDEGRSRSGRAPVRLLLLSWVVSIGVILASWGVLWKLRAVLEANHLLPFWVGALLLLAAAAPLLLLVPASRSGRAVGRSRRAERHGDVTNMRIHSADAREWAYFAIGYAIATLLGFLVIFFIISNNVAVGKTFFKLSLIGNSFWLVLQAFVKKNIYIFCVAQVFILIWGMVIAVAKMIPGRAGQPIRFLASAYTDAFRGLPSIISIYLIGFGLPLAGVPWVKNWPLTWLAILALTLTYGAYVAEVYRAGIESIHPSQTMAARSLGLSFSQTLRFVVIPQAVRRIIPPLLNDFISLQKDTALINIIGAIDVFNQAKIIASNEFNLSAVTTVAILFMIITIPQTRFVDRLLVRQQQRLRG